MTTVAGRLAFKEVKAAHTTSSHLHRKGSGTAPEPSKSSQSSQELNGHATNSATSLAEHERVLRAFDFSTKFGPCVGLTRLQRWERAARLQLDPPVEVKQLLDKYGSSSRLNECVWAGHI